MLRERRNRVTSMLCTEPREKEDMIHTIGGLIDHRIWGGNPGWDHTITDFLLPGLVVGGRHQPEVGGRLVGGTKKSNGAVRSR